MVLKRPVAARASFKAMPNGAGSTGSEKHPFQIPRRQFGKFLRQLDGWNIRVTPGAEGKLLHLAGDGLNHPRMAKPDLMNVVAVEIQHIACWRSDVRAIATLQHIQTRRGQRLVQKIFRVLIQPMACFGVDVFGDRSAPRRQIQVAFGFKLLGLRDCRVA